jgi:hypothetical protein
MSRLASCVSIALLVACGGTDKHESGIDAAVDGTPIDGLPPGCDYLEQHDSTNDDVPPATGTAEMTNLAFSSQSVICGSFDASHFDGDITVDVDGYLVSVASDSDVLVRLGAAGAENIELVAVDIYPGPTYDQRIGGLTFYGDHGVASVHLPAGSYEFSVYALNSAAITANVSYTLAVIADTPALRCPGLTTGGYMEANDGGSNNGNDVIKLASGMPPALTSSGTDAPEPTGLTLSPTAGDQRVYGTAANIASPDLYEDKDTYAFSTSPMTNELTVRLTWAGTATNLDYYLFEANNVDPVLRAIGTATSAPEVSTFSIKPSTDYWLLVGAKAGTTVPMDYSASLCPAHFAP